MPDTLTLVPTALRHRAATTVPGVLLLQQLQETDLVNAERARVVPVHAPRDLVRS
jgi:hypothetical protein